MLHVEVNSVISFAPGSGAALRELDGLDGLDNHGICCCASICAGPFSCGTLIITYSSSLQTFPHSLPQVTCAAALGTCSDLASASITLP